MGEAFEQAGRQIGLTIDIVARFVDIVAGAIEKVQALYSAIKNSPGGKLLGALFSSSATALSAPALMGPSSAFMGPAGLLANPAGGTLRAAWDPFSSSSSWSSSGRASGLVVLDRRTITIPLTVEAGVGDPIAIAAAVKDLLASAAVQLGQATAYGDGR